MGTRDTPRHWNNPPGPLDVRDVFVWARLGLIVSVLILAMAPLAVDDSYSILSHTLSESGGQGVEGSWVFRTGVVMTAVSVFLLTTVAKGVWSSAARRLLHVYSIALVGLVVFPESSWDGSTQDATVARLHTVAGVVGAVAFILAVVAIARSRPGESPSMRVFDWVVVGAVALIPQLMLMAPADGVLQRLMVALGYAWLFAETAALGSRLNLQRA